MFYLRTVCGDSGDTGGLYISEVLKVVDIIR